MSFNSSRRGIAAALLALTCVPLSAQSKAPAQPPSELDAFMEKVLARREVNRQTLEQYVLDEVESVSVLGPGRMPLWRTKREFRWYVRDGLHVRSPLRFDGVGVGDEARQRYEEDWARRERTRLERKKNEKEEKGRQAKEGTDENKNEPRVDEPVDDPSPAPSGSSPIPTPRFVSEAYFMDFKFEPGNYYLAGREKLDGQDVVRIEYYPTRMFDDDNDGDKDKGGEQTSVSVGATGSVHVEKKEESREERRRRERRQRPERDRERELEQRIDRQMNKTAMVTLWIDPREHQIVKYTFDNVWMDFLPGAWLVRVDDIRASMTMGQPFPGVWLPNEMSVHAGVTLANGSFEATYGRTFADYRQATTTTKLRVPKLVDGSGSKDQRERQTQRPEDLEPSTDEVRGPFACCEQEQPQAQPAGEVVAEIRVHGNAYLPDDEVIRLSGAAVGQPVAPDSLREIERRLDESRRFESIEVRKRYQSLESTTDVVIVLVVHERPGVTEATPDLNIATRPWHRVRSRLMFLPILTYADGYGFSYGGRVSTIDLLGMGERLSVPLTWGGTRRAAIELERTFKTGPLTRVESSFGISQRENPRFEIDDQRVELKGRVERHFAGVVRTGFGAERSTVHFGVLDDPLWTVGADAALDTRGDPAFPRNAVLLNAGWTGLHVRETPRINRYLAEARGYLGVFRQIVLAGRIQHIAADRTLPPYERVLLGGSSTIRGFATGTFDGDRTLVASAELRMPITSVLSSAKLGVTAFMDAGTAYDFDARLENATWHRGVGGGVFLIAPLLKLNLDIAKGLKTGDTRVHLSSGFTF